LSYSVSEFANIGRKSKGVNQFLNHRFVVGPHNQVDGFVRKNEIEELRIFSRSRGKVPHGIIPGSRFSPKAKATVITVSNDGQLKLRHKI
jgi:hypothetical protein